ncbi:MAG TPA: L,D-transpeptidase [Blastocatellia bacterium]|nr:L,D-transpeptidase [Blastocatellia bacterium]
MAHLGKWKITSPVATLLAFLLTLAAGGIVTRPTQSPEGGRNNGRARPDPAELAALGITVNSIESARSDKFTGGRIERAAFRAGDPRIAITVDIPAFRLTLWQDRKEVATYQIGVGMKDFPLPVGERVVNVISFNPSWIPPDSDWVYGRSNVRPHEVIKASDPRNPLGKIKIPLGDSFLIHEAAKRSDIGGLVSHGCVRMLRRDLFDLAEKIIAARGLPVSAKELKLARTTSRRKDVPLDAPLPVDLNYDTQVIEGGVLRLYPDVYDNDTNTVENLRLELRSSGVDDARLDDRTLKEMLKRVSRRYAFVVSVADLKAGRALTAGRNVPLTGNAQKKPEPQTARTKHL